MNFACAVFLIRVAAKIFRRRSPSICAVFLVSFEEWIDGCGLLGLLGLLGFFSIVDARNINDKRYQKCSNVCN